MCIKSPKAFDKKASALCGFYHVLPNQGHFIVPSITMAGLGKTLTIYMCDLIAT